MTKFADQRAGDPQETELRPVIFVNRFFYPDSSATSQILSDVAFYLAQTGRPVRIITSAMSYQDARALPSHEIVKGVEVRRLRTTRFGRANLMTRAFDYISFYLSATWFAIRSVKKGDILVAKTDPPLVSVPMGLVARFKRARLVNWLQDIYPETASELGVSVFKGPIGAFLRALRNRSLKRAVLNIVIGQTMAERVKKEGVTDAQIAHIHNFVDDEAIRPLEDHAPDLRQAWGLTSDDFVIGYSGNLGRAHDIETILDAAEALQTLPKVKFLFVGGGHLRTELEERVKKRSLRNIVFKPYQPREQLKETLGLPNVHWVTLKDALEGLIVPSKLYGIAAAGRPVIMIGSCEGEIGRLIKEFQFGVSVSIGDSDTLIEQIRAFATDPAPLSQMGKNGRLFVEQTASRARAFEQWAEVLGQLDRTP